MSMFPKTSVCTHIYVQLREKNDVCRLKPICHSDAFFSYGINSLGCDSYYLYSNKVLF